MKKLIYMVLLALALPLPGKSWTADNGNGTFSNPLFYDEFSDPDLIRVGDDFYLTGTTMHAMPGLPVLHSKDLVNWELLGYAFDRLDLGPEFRLENGNVYGQGIWAPSFRYHNGTFYIFANVNHHKTQLFTATNPAGPWKHTELKASFHDLSVLFDDDGKVYVIWGYSDIHFAQLNDQLDDVVPGSERVLFPKNSPMGEGSHFYKVNGEYYILSARFDGRMRMPCARADKPDGPYEVNPEISADEAFGIPEGNRLVDERASDFKLRPADTKRFDRNSMHQGGIVDTPKGEWWGFSMMDYNSVGRLTCLSPITWQEGWPYFGLPGNLKRTPRTWVKPDTGHASPPSAPYQRNDEFNGPQFANVWQWNHVPVDDHWSLTERVGYLRLHSLPAPDFWNARNTLTQRSIGPESIPTAELDTSGLAAGDVAGLALLNYPYARIGVARTSDGFELQQFDQTTGKTVSAPFAGDRVWLRAHCDFLTEKATFSYSTDGKTFQPLGNEFTMIFQGRTFQGVRYSLFNYNTSGASGGYADFDHFTVDEPHLSGFTRPIPYDHTITLENMRDNAVLVVKDGSLAAVASSDPLATTTAAQFKVGDRKLGRVSLQSVADGRVITVTGLGADGRVSLAAANADDDSQAFQWTEMPRGDLLLLSLASDRHLRIKPDNGTITADAPGAQSDRQNGASFTWRDIAPPPSAQPGAAALPPSASPR
jgi:beta-xylosidase